MKNRFTEEYDFLSFLKDSDIPDDQFDAEQLAMGIEVEHEHIKDSVPEELGNDIAKGIAKAHLREIPNYYSRLQRMENEAKKELGVKNEE